jgi:protein-S-isoprenylcysteine O-methyltransferase Ste14
MHRLELRVPPLVLVALFAAAIVAASVWMPLVRVPVPGHRALAVLLVLAGLGVALAGVLAFRRVRTTVNPMAPQRTRTVVRTGLYRLSRNPMYLGLALALLGLAAWGSSLTGYALVAGVLRIPDPVPDQARRARPAAALRARICRLHGPGAALDLSPGSAGGHPKALLMKK